MKKINKMIQQHRDWLSQSEGLVAQALEYIKEDLASNTLGGLDNVSDSLGILATYYGISGVVSVNDNMQSGWDDVSKSIIYRYWALKLRAKSFSKTAFLKGIKSIPNLTNQLSNAGCLLAGFISTDRDDLASSVADLVLGMFTVKGAVDPIYLKKRRFEPFVLWLYSVYSGKEIYSEIKQFNLGVYQRVIDSWDNTNELNSVIQELCEYHLSNTEDVGGSWDPEFKYRPFDMLPLEILAIVLVRKKLGMDSPILNHPLLLIATASVEHIVIAPDDIVIEVENVYNNLFKAWNEGTP